MSDKNHLPGIPAVDKKIDRNVRSVLDPVVEILRAMVSGTNPAVRMESLINAGIIDGNDGDVIVPPITSDFTPPPAPTGLTIDGALANMILSWDPTTNENVAYTEIWRAEADDFSTAVMVGQAPVGAEVYIDAVNHTGIWYYWIRYVSYANIAGPFNAQTGTMGETGVDPEALLELLTGERTSPFFNQFPFLIIQTPLTINGVHVPAGVYIEDAYIANGTISNAKIGNLAVDTAKIALLAVGAAQIANLAVTNAKIANLAVTTAKIADLTVTTLKIGDQAVTIPASAFATQGNLTTATGVFFVPYTLSLTIISTGAPIILIASGTYEQAPNIGAMAVGVISIKRGSTVLTTAENTSPTWQVGPGFVINSSICTTIQDTPGVGTFTYTVTLTGHAEEGAVLLASKAKNVSLLALETKK